MTYDKLRYLEQLLSKVYTDGIQEYREEVEEYFKENYSEDSLVKPLSTQEVKIDTKDIEQTKKLSIPDDLEERIGQAIERVFGET